MAKKEPAEGEQDYTCLTCYRPCKCVVLDEKPTKYLLVIKCKKCGDYMAEKNKVNKTW